MKNKHFVVLFLIGFIILMFGALLKVGHTEFLNISGNQILAVGLGIEFTVALFFVIKVCRDNDNNWLNK